jgi:hypothetical protein
LNCEPAAFAELNEKAMKHHTPATMGRLLVVYAPFAARSTTACTSPAVPLSRIAFTLPAPFAQMTRWLVSVLSLRIVHAVNGSMLSMAASAPLSTRSEVAAPSVTAPAGIVAAA